MITFARPGTRSLYLRILRLRRRMTPKRIAFVIDMSPRAVRMYLQLAEQRRESAG